MAVRRSCASWFRSFGIRDNAGGSNWPKGLNDYEVPLFSAIESAIKDDSCHVIALPREAMLGPVSEFIEGLEKAAETDPEVLKDKPWSASQIRTQRETDLKRFIDMFCTKALNDDLFFLYTVLARWAGILEYDDRDQPSSPIMSALQFELDHQHWVMRVPSARTIEACRTLIALANEEGWLGELLNWIAEKQETITPCEIGKEAFRIGVELDQQTAKAGAA